MTEILVLRLVHVLGGIFWVGSGLFTALFLTPVLMKSGPAAGAVMSGLQQRRLFTALPVAALLTILSGARLMWIMSGGFSPAYFSTVTGRTFALSAVAAIVGFLLALFVARPAMVRAGAAAASAGSLTDEASRASMEAAIYRLRRRGALASQAATWLLVLSAAGMAVARYVA